MTQVPPNEPEVPKNTPESTPHNPAKGEVEAVLEEQHQKGEQLLQKLPELTPEQIEAIMGKVQDIDAKGVAFTVLIGKFNSSINKEFFLDEICRDAFKDGLIGMSSKFDRNKQHPKDVYLDKDKQNIKRAKIFFNIVGRMNDVEELKKKNMPGLEISHSNYFSSRWKFYSDDSGHGSWERTPDKFHRPSLAVIFDVSRYTELVPTPRRKLGQRRSFRIDSAIHDTFTGDQRLSYHDYSTDTRFEDALLEMRLKGETQYVHPSDIKPESEYGFITYGRIAPRNFRGIVVNELVRDSDASFQQIVSSIREARKGKEQDLVPIYDNDGNLLWPKQMTYEEVKKFTQKRDADRKNDSHENL